MDVIKYYMMELFCIQHMKIGELNIILSQQKKEIKDENFIYLFFFCIQ